jgi:hypothetical protein
MDLIWIEKELQQTDLKPATRTALQALEQKALQGKLRSGELEAVRRKQPTGCGFRSKVTKRFGNKLPVISEQSYHAFRSKVTTFGG